MSLLMNCLKCPQLDREVPVPNVVRVSEGTADHTEGQKALKDTVEHVICECKKRGTTYTDDEFPNHEKEGPDVVRVTDKWLKIDNVNPRAPHGRKTWSLFDDPQPADVCQGDLADCWLVGAISVIADKPDVLRRIFVTQKYNKQGIYGLQLYVDGEWKYIIVDDRFPCNRHGELVFAWGKKMQLWVPLLEKAMAKLFGSYSALNKGLMSSALKFLTGSPLELIHKNNMSTEDARRQVFDRLRYALRDNLLTCCSTVAACPELTAVSLRPDHSYTILDTVVVDSVLLLLVRNTWGFHSYTGRWSPNSDHWNAISNKDCLPSTLGDAESGTFWIAMEDFVKYFKTIMISHTRANYHEYHVKAKLPRSSDDTWDTFEIEVEENTRIDINFHLIRKDAVRSIPEQLMMAAVIYDENGQLIGSAKCEPVHLMGWRTKLLSAGHYRVYTLAFSKWNEPQPVEYNIVVHSSQQITLKKVAERASLLALQIMKFAVGVGTKNQQGDVTFYTVQRKAWEGGIIAASNCSKTERALCVTTRVEFENVTSTRTLRNTYDLVEPGSSQILQILTRVDRPVDSYEVSYHFVGVHVQRDRAVKFTHNPALKQDTLPLHDSLSNDLIFTRDNR